MDQDTGWTVLAATGPAIHPDPPVSWRRIVIQSAAAAIAVFALVAIAGTVAARRAAESESVNRALEVTDLLAGAVVAPALEDALLDRRPAVATAAVGRLDRVIRVGVLVDPIVRIKIWDSSGRIVYSDEPSLIGQVFPLDPEEKQVLAKPSTRAEISDLRKPENRDERSLGKLLEVYRPVWTPGGKPLLFETYSGYDVVAHRSVQLWRGFAGITLSSLLFLLVLQGVVTWALVGRVRRAQRQHEVLLDRAVSASQEERRRIAGTLHDGVVQDLTASAFAVAGAAERARAEGAYDLAERLEGAATTVRGGLGGLRSLLVDIYPASLRSSGLAAVLDDLSTTLRARGVDVELDVPPDVALPARVEALMFRIAQECLRNTARHADPSRVTIAVTQSDGAVSLEVADDGVGFDADEALRNPRTGHFGLRVMTDLAKEEGAELSVRTAPGEGTRWRLHTTL